MNIRILLPESKDPDCENKIASIHKALSFAAPAIIEHHGRLTGVTEAGIEAVFENGDNVLEGAFAVIRTASQVQKDDTSSLSVGIHFGPVFITKVSYGDFSTTLAISGGMREAHRLSRCASRYGAAILITETAAKNIRAFRTRFAARRLGAVLNAENGNREIVYDVFDSDPTEIKYRKRRSRLVFENGVEMFLEGNYSKARSYFIELLKYDRNDIAAKKYVFLCDKALSEKQVVNEVKYLEIWN